MTRRIISLFLCILMILPLSACGKGEDPAVSAAADELIPGWLPEEIPVPKELGCLDTAWACCDERLLSILKEEARACFADQYSIEEAARRSQQRAMLWLAEQG